MKPLIKDQQKYKLNKYFISFSEREELIEAFNERLRNNEEGLVIKKHDMKYKPNVRDGGGCYKIKAEVKKYINYIFLSLQIF